jgi:hypothetical protein
MPRAISRKRAKGLGATLARLDVTAGSLREVLSLGEAREIVRVWESYTATRTKGTEEAADKMFEVSVTGQGTISLYLLDYLLAKVRLEIYEKHKRER